MKFRHCVFAISFGVACTEEESSSSFPDIIEPLEELRIEAPEGTAADPYPEEFVLLSADEGEYAWVHLRGYIKTDMAQAWSAIRSDQVYINHRSVTEYSVEELDLPEYDYAYLVHNFSENIVDVEFDNEWRHAAVEGTVDSPERVAIRWQKIAGTEFIQMMEGSIQIVATAKKDVVEVQVIEHLTATLDQEGKIIEFVSDLYERWRLYVHGEDLPDYTQ